MNDNGQYLSLIWANKPNLILPVLKGEWEDALSQASSPQTLRQLIGYAALCDRNFISTEEYIRHHEIPQGMALDGVIFITAPTLLNLIPKDQKPEYEQLTAKYGVGSNGVCELSFLTQLNRARNEMELEARLQYDTDAKNLHIPARVEQYRELAGAIFPHHLSQAEYSLKNKN